VFTWVPIESKLGIVCTCIICDLNLFTSIILRFYRMPYIIRTSAIYRGILRTPFWIAKSRQTALKTASFGGPECTKRSFNGTVKSLITSQEHRESAQRSQCESFYYPLRLLGLCTLQ
jgi:hypothetical protein